MPEAEAEVTDKFVREYGLKGPEAVIFDEGALANYRAGKRASTRRLKKKHAPLLGPKTRP